MSSTYHLLCLSHDPAIIIGGEFSLRGIETAARDHEALHGHQGCDIMAGRYSYPLIEAGCFGRQMTGPTGCRSVHSGLLWADADWLRLLAAAIRAPAGSVHLDVVDPFTSRCWTLDRLRRLHAELGIAA